MKQMKFQLLTLFLCASMLLCAVACTPTAPIDPTPGAGNSSEGNQLGIVVDGEAKYRVVRGELESAGVRSSMVTLIDAIENATGVRLAPVNDYEPYDENVVEIIVGKDNNRPAAQGVVDSLEYEGFRIVAVDGNIVIAGNTDETTDAAVAYFIKTYLAQPGKTLTVPEETDVAMSMLQWQLETRFQTETLKSSYSDYIRDYKEKDLVAFDESEDIAIVFENGYYDDRHSTDRYGALRWDLIGKKDLARLVTCPVDSFSFDASDKNASTLKLWLYVSDTDRVVCDHDALQGFQSNQATFYFRAVDAKGRLHCWNHTITNAGWHEIELSFNIHNGADKDFDYGNIEGFWMSLSTYDDVTIMLDDLRGVTYKTDYVPATVEGEKNPRLISDGEYNALDGAILQEWYGASYDLTDKVQGASSLRNMGDGSVTDFRTVVANLNIGMDYDKDELVFHMKLKKLSAVKSFFIELNQVQDKHEYEQSFTVAQLQGFGLSTEDDTWSEVRIPLSVFRKNLNAEYGDTVTLQNFRMVAGAASGAIYDFHIDHIYLAEK